MTRAPPYTTTTIPNEIVSRGYVMYTGQNLDDLRFAFEVLEVQGFESFEEVWPEHVTVAVSEVEAEEISNLDKAKAWIKLSRNTTVRWFGVDPLIFNWIAWYLELQPIAEYSEANPDQHVFLIEDESIIDHLLVDLGGEILGKTPLRAVLSNSRNDRRNYNPELMWVSRKAYNLIEAALRDPRIEPEMVKRGRLGLMYWFGEVSNNAMELVLRRITRTVEKPDAENFN